MAVKIQLRRGTEAEYNTAHGDSAITPADGEVLVVQESGTSGGYLVIGDGSTSWLDLRNDVDGRVYFKPAYSQTIMGGEQPVDATPLTVKGATSQTAPIFVVEDKAGNDILKVSDDESTDSPTAALVAVESHGQTADVVMSILGQLNQFDDASGGDLLRVQPDSTLGGKGLKVDHSGNVSIAPADDGGVTDTALVVTSASDSDNPVFQVKKANGNDLFKVTLTAVHSNGPELIVSAAGDLTSNVTLVGTTDAAVKAITVDDGGTENFAVTAGGKITSNGHHGAGVVNLVDSDILTFKDFKSLRQGKRTLSVLDTPVDGRQNVAFRIQEFVGNNGSFTSTEFDHLLTHTIEQTTSPNVTNTDPDLHTTPSGSVFQIFKIPNGESCTVTFNVLAFGARSGSPIVTDDDIIVTTQILTYTSKDLLTGKSVVSEQSVQSSGGFGGLIGVNTFPRAQCNNSATIPNSTGSDLFVAVAMKIVNSDAPGSNDHFRAREKSDDSGLTSNMDITIVGNSGF